MFIVALVAPWDLHEQNPLEVAERTRAEREQEKKERATENENESHGAEHSGAKVKSCCAYPIKT